jgi:SAM-dependent methyltransferase
MLSLWAIPDDLIASAPAPPYFFDPQVFIDAADEALARADDTPSDAVARAALPTDGSVLDVGCGAGAASLRLRPGRAVGVDPSPALLEAFTERANSLGIEGPRSKGPGRRPPARLRSVTWLCVTTSSTTSPTLAASLLP